jgi:UDP-N-acetylmuramoyl-tripeptide--D-alanyl-D-alanine ligase
MATPIPENHACFTLFELLVATDGALIQGGDEVVRGVSTDTRAVKPGNVFVALVGGRHDGHAHAAEAAERGARAVVVSRDVALPAGVAVVRVQDTLGALGALGRAHRRRWSAAGPAGRRVVGITGSVGKTTTRAATAAALRAAGFLVHASRGNLNNAVGIPMVLLELRAEHEVAVLEVGTSSRGEIAHGCSLIEQDVGVITRVAAAHTEQIGTVDDVAREKGSMFASLRRGGVAVGNGDDPRVRAQLLRSPAGRWFTYGTAEDTDLRIVGREAQGFSSSRVSLRFGERAREELRVFGEIELTLPLLGDAGAYAAGAAVLTAAALRPGLEAEAVRRAFAGLEGEEGRLQAVPLADGSVLLDDCYNANRASTVASLRTAGELARAEGRRLLAVLGEMRELGPLAEEEHRAVGEEAAAQGVAALVAVQGDAAAIARAAGERGAEAIFVPDAPAALEAIRGRLRPGDLLLVKGSRGVGLDLVVRALKSLPGS